MVNLPTPILTFLYVHPIIGSVALFTVNEDPWPGTLFLPFFFHSLSHCLSVCAFITINSGNHSTASNYG